MKVGDLVEVKFWRDYWCRGWRVYHIHGGEALVERAAGYRTDYNHLLNDYTEGIHKLSLKDMRPETTTKMLDEWGVLDEDPLPPLPEEGSWVMFQVPNHAAKEWTVGLVMKKNAKSISVWWKDKMLSRQRQHFIQMEAPA